MPSSRWAIRFTASTIGSPKRLSFNSLPDSAQDNWWIGTHCLIYQNHFFRFWQQFHSLTVAKLPPCKSSTPEIVGFAELLPLAFVILGI